MSVRGDQRDRRGSQREHAARGRRACDWDGTVHVVYGVGCVVDDRTGGAGSLRHDVARHRNRGRRDVPHHNIFNDGNAVTFVGHIDTVRMGNHCDKRRPLAHRDGLDHRVAHAVNDPDGVAVMARDVDAICQRVDVDVRRGWPDGDGRRDGVLGRTARHDVDDRNRLRGVVRDIQPIVVRVNCEEVGVGIRADLGDHGEVGAVRTHTPWPYELVT